MENEEKVVEVNNAPTEEQKVEANPNNNKGDRRPPKKEGENGNGNQRRRRPRPVEVKEYEETVVDINRISKTVQGGRRMKFSALVVIGNKKGKYGFAQCKANEVPDAIKKALDKAKRNTFSIPLSKGDTIPHEIMGQFGATKVFLKPAKEGTGIVAGGAVRAILELAGIRNVVSKVYGSRTAINVVRASHEGLKNLKSYTKVKSLRG